MTPTDTLWRATHDGHWGARIRPLAVIYMHAALRHAMPRHAAEECSAACEARHDAASLETALATVERVCKSGQLDVNWRTINVARTALRRAVKTANASLGA